MRAVTIDSDLATLFTFTPRKPPIGRGGRNVKRFGFVKRLSRLFSRATGARPVSHSASGQRAERLLQACLQPSRTRCGGS